MFYFFSYKFYIIFLPFDKVAFVKCRLSGRFVILGWVSCWLLTGLLPASCPRRPTCLDTFASTVPLLHSCHLVLRPCHPVSYPVSSLLLFFPLSHFSLPFFFFTPFPQPNSFVNTTFTKLVSVSLVCSSFPLLCPPVPPHISFHILLISSLPHENTK